MTKRTAEEVQAVATAVEQWADTVEADELREIPLHELRAIATLVATIDQAEAALSAAVHEARRHGRTWSQIGLALGVSKQAAQQRFGSPASV